MQTSEAFADRRVEAWGAPMSAERSANARPLPNTMAKVEFDIGIDSVRGILMGDDPYYIRRYPDKNGAVMHIVQARPNRRSHKPTTAEQQNRIDFAERYGAQRHAEFLERKWKNQLELPLE